MTSPDHTDPKATWGSKASWHIYPGTVIQAELYNSGGIGKMPGGNGKMHPTMQIWVYCDAILPRGCRRWRAKLQAELGSSLRAMLLFSESLIIWV